MSGQTRDGNAQYLGIINGIVYRIGNAGGGFGQVFELVPLEIQPVAVGDHLRTSSDGAVIAAKPPSQPSVIAPFGVTNTSGQMGASESTAEHAPLHEERNVALFTREGPEPLRAGHPDLWRLLVAGTCLEGSTFRSNG